jgi:hypothetical protein
MQFVTLAAKRNGLNAMVTKTTILIARAYRLLESLDLGPEFSGKDAVGEIRFIDGACPGNDYLGTLAPSQLDIALLQCIKRELTLHQPAYPGEVVPARRCGRTGSQTGITQGCRSDVFDNAPEETS